MLKNFIQKSFAHNVEIYFDYNKTEYYEVKITDIQDDYFVAAILFPTSGAKVFYFDKISYVGQMT